MQTSARGPELFPLGENRPFLSEREWTCLRLICHNENSIADCEASELVEATAHQIDNNRASQLIEISRISRLPGLGTWMARLLVEAGIVIQDLTSIPADQILQRVNTRVGYPICNAACIAAFTLLQATWRNSSASHIR